MNEEKKDLEYWKNNCEEDYITTPISVLRYIGELEKAINKNSVIPDVSESISVTKDELNKFLEDWDDGFANKFDADWDIKSIKIAEFLGLTDD